MNREEFMTPEEAAFKSMCLGKEAAILCSVFPDAYLRVNFNATLKTLTEAFDDLTNGFYGRGNAVISLWDYNGGTLFHEFAHYLASVFPKDEFKQIASQCLKEMRGDACLKGYPKKKHLEESFCYYFEFTMMNPNKRNNAFIQKLKALYASVNPSEEFEKEKIEEFMELRRGLGDKIIVLTHILYHVDNTTYNEAISIYKSNPECADIVERSEKLNEGAL